MRHAPKAFALAALFVLLSFSSALGQSDRQTIIYIPFKFSVGEKSFASGTYAIERNKRDSDLVWVIKRKGNNGSAVVMTQPVSSSKTMEETRLVFHRYEDVYFLAEFWTPGSNTGRQVQLSDREKVLEKTLAGQRVDHVLIDRGR